MSIQFEWDSRKYKINIEKHGVSFDEAKTVFEDFDARIIDDPEHSEEENRFVILGFSEKTRLLVVCHCCRFDDTIRIISARKATTQESKTYGRFKK